jgi:hypothetical protein
VHHLEGTNQAQAQTKRLVDRLLPWPAVALREGG